MIRFENIQGIWPTKPLGEVVQFLDHLRRPVRESERKPGPYPYFGANGQQGTICDYIFNEPLILLAEDGGFFGQSGKTIAYEIDGKTWVNNHAHVLRMNGDIDRRYLLRHLEYYDVTRWINGTTRAKLTKANAEAIEIAVPPLDEQRRIAAILDKADAIRRKRRQALAETEVLLRATFLDMFGDPRLPTGRFPMAPLADFGDVVTGNTPSREDLSNYGEFIEWIKSDNISEAYYYLPEAKERLSRKGAKLARTVPHGSTLVTCIAGSPSSIGNAALADRPVSFNQQINAIVPNSSTDSFFLFSQFLVGKQKVQRASTNSMKGMVSKSRFESIEFIKPPVPVQREFGIFAKRVIGSAFTGKRSEQLGEELFASLSQRAFRCEL